MSGARVPRALYRHPVDFLVQGRFLELLTATEHRQLPSFCYQMLTAASNEYAVVSSIDRGDSALSRILSKLKHLDLTGRISNKVPAMEAHGGYCDVFVGYVPSEGLHQRVTICAEAGEVRVAIKRLRVRLNKDYKLAKTLAREMSVWSKLNHPSILPLLGYIFEKDYPSLIPEWIEHGTVREFLKGHPECDLIYLARGIAEGLKYIHEKDIVHSDMKADNVLVSKDWQPLICDFGISRMLNSSQSGFVSTTHINRTVACWR